MIYIYGDDYIKYLNDDSAGQLTYDQWKSKKNKSVSTKTSSSGTFHASNYTHGYHSPGVINKKYRQS
ncbi:hypothetical protein [Bacillus sp. FJAT-29814]|uniref:hypothetical protein n=1 Tax=Bacillus sp. FJAT-29814 TaxID=1729688 RepID=UPI0008342993|nr:hypothetical protein [Bacillus sp. FJAT-29814]